QTLSVEDSMHYDFLVDTYETERLKVLSVWAMFDDADLTIRPNPTDSRGRNLLEQMIHQCISENLWFKNMLGIDVSAPPLPSEETRLAFIQRYAVDSSKRLESLRTSDDAWWERSVTFFDVTRSRAWVMTRRITHTAHHRGQQTTLLRVLNREIYSTYGPTADTGGLMVNRAPTIYAYPDVDTLLEQEATRREKTPLPGAAKAVVTERP
ncbi:MAG TPA: DinB family protein, partial [Chloroflexota bacterium]